MNKKTHTNSGNATRSEDSQTENQQPSTAAERHECPKTGQSADEATREEWLAIRKEAGRKIDPETADVMWTYAQTGDPYDLYPPVEGPGHQVGREYFARSPGSEIWVWFGDLPQATHDALWEKHKRNLAFPAGLPNIIRNDKQ